MQEIKELPKSYKKQPVDEAELNMAKTLVASMDKPFDSSMYHELQRRSLMSNTTKIEIAAKKMAVSYTAFDILYLNDKQITDLPLEKIGMKRSLKITKNG